MILAKVAAGLPEAMEECLGTYGGMVWSLALRMTAGREDAEEAVQEIFIDVWKHAGRFDPAVASETTFIAMIARRRLIDRRRRQTVRPRFQRLEDHGEMAQPAAACAVEVRDEFRHVSRLLESLRPEERLVLRLALGEGCSQAVIAERTGLPMGTVKSHARRGLIRLRDLVRRAAADDTLEETPSPARKS
jgi:RNA polymerase sigma factor (sigma-70 family)